MVAGYRDRKTELLTGDELNHLLDTLDSWPYQDSAALIGFALFTRMRGGRLFKLTLDDVDFAQSMVTLRNPKGGKTVTIPLNDQATNNLTHTGCDVELRFSPQMTASKGQISRGHGKGSGR